MPDFLASRRLALTLAALALTAGCTDSPPPSSGAAATAPALASAAAAPAAGASALGDLSPFRSLAEDVAGQVARGNLVDARARVKDLELAWDDAESGLKPRAVDDWHRLDKAIDRALEALRSQPATQTACQAAMTDLLRTFDQLQGRR